ncbi:MAG: hypothetical protein AAFX05_08980 [Planctomycetota bacterium]
MADFFDVAIRCLSATHPDLRRVLKLRAELQRVAAKARVDLYNLESVFVAAEMANVLGSLGSLSNDEVEEAPRALQRVISLTIQKSMQFTARRSGPERSEPVFQGAAGYLELVNHLRAHHDRGCAWPSVITFNYDVGLEMTLIAAGVPYSYSANGEPDEDSVRIHKLHGSINWFPIEGSDKVHCPAYTLRGIENYIWKGGLDRFTLPIERDREHTDDGAAICHDPLIVPPTDSKLGHRQRMLKVWRAAAVDLQRATNVAVIGFSLPWTDDFFRHFWAISTISDQLIDRFVLVDPSRSTHDRFTQLLAPGVMERYRWLEGTLLHQIDDLTQLLLGDLPSQAPHGRRQGVRLHR